MAMAALLADLRLLEWIYLALFCGGLFYALFLAVFGLGHGQGAGHAGHGDLGQGHIHMDTGHGVAHIDSGHGAAHADASHGGGAHAADHTADSQGKVQGKTHVGLLNPVIIATFFSGFGGFGLLGTRLFHLPTAVSVLVAVPAGALLASGFFFLYNRVAVAAETNGTVTWQDLRGARAEVITPIPEHGLGEIMYVARGARGSAPARSIDGIAIARETKVTILKMIDGVAIVDLRYIE